MDFTNTILQWYAENGRDLPWRRTKNPYAIWLSEKSKEFAEHERIAEENNSDSNVRVEQNAATKSNRQKVKGEKIA